MSTECTTKDCSGCSIGDCADRKESFQVEPNAYSRIGNVIGVVSGKGGVGKSLIAGELAVLLRRSGYRVGILDADITGPSIPKMFGIHEPAVGSEEGIWPAQTQSGIKIISINMMLEDEETPVIWRGPILASVVKQFWNEVLWGDLDYLLVDMPPGTGDVPLTVFQSLPVTGIVIVSSPQELVEMIVKKAYRMAQDMKIPVVGLVQNMSYVVCPDCGKKIYIYGTGRGDELARELGIPSYAQMPIEPRLAALCDQGEIEQMSGHELDEIIKTLEGFAVKN